MNAVLDSIKQINDGTFNANIWADFPRGYTPPDWLPCWSDPTKYTDHGDDLQLWAWEFLRRNPEYQSDYAQWVALPDTNDEGSWSPKHKRTSFGEWERMLFFYADPPALSEDETVAEYRQRTGEWPELLHVFLLRKWGLEVMPAARRVSGGIVHLVAYQPLKNFLPAVLVGMLGKSENLSPGV